MNWTNKIQVYNEDCMGTMSRYEDNFFDLAIVDPPYGINIQKMSFTQNKKGGIARRTDYSNISEWDSNIPSINYFEELFRVSKSQIIWGGNYFANLLPNSMGWILWDKKTEDKYSNDFADGELAWTSFKKPLRIFRFLWHGMIQQNMKEKETRIHPTQKPVALYRWLLDKYAKPNDIILDTHLGSGSNAIACHWFGCELVAAELDEEYYQDSFKRFKKITSQTKLF